MTRGSIAVVVLCVVGLPIWTQGARNQRSSDMLPSGFEGVQIGGPASSLLGPRTGIRENTLLKAGGREKSYVERLPNAPFFSEAVYGVMDDAVSFVYLVGPPTSPRYPLASYVKSLVNGAIRKYGAKYETQIMTSRVNDLTFEQVLFFWKLNDVNVGIAVPTVASLQAVSDGRDSTGTIGKIRFAAFDRRSLIAPKLFGFERRQQAATESSEIDAFLRSLTTIVSEAPEFK